MTAEAGRAALTMEGDLAVFRSITLGVHAFTVVKHKQASLSVVVLPHAMADRVWVQTLGGVERVLVSETASSPAHFVLSEGATLHLARQRAVPLACSRKAWITPFGQTGPADRGSTESGVERRRARVEQTVPKVATEHAAPDRSASDYFVGVTAVWRARGGLLCLAMSWELRNVRRCDSAHAYHHPRPRSAHRCSPAKVPMPSSC